MNFPDDQFPFPAQPPDEAAFQHCEFNVTWIPVIIGALEALKQFQLFVSPPSDYIAQIDELINRIMTDVPSVDQIPVGMISPFAEKNGAMPPKWLFCDGRLLLRATYPLLFACIGSQYGANDGATNFRLPRIDFNVILGAASQSSAVQGNTGGASNATLSIANLPAHNHQEQSGNNVPLRISSGAGTNNVIAAQTTGGNVTKLVTTDTGSGTSFSIMNPYMLMAFGIYAGE